MGPAIMPGGRPSLSMVEPILTTIAAVAEGEPCVAYMGPQGAGTMSNGAQWRGIAICS